MSERPVEVVLYGRPGCHLCDDARDVVRRVAGVRTFALSERDIESDPELLRAYLERIPVITVAGREVAALWVDADTLLAALDAAQNPPADRLESGSG